MIKSPGNLNSGAKDGSSTGEFQAVTFTGEGVYVAMRRAGFPAGRGGDNVPAQTFSAENEVDTLNLSSRAGIIGCFKAEVDIPAVVDVPVLVDVRKTYRKSKPGLKGRCDGGDAYVAPIVRQRGIFRPQSGDVKGKTFQAAAFYAHDHPLGDSGRRDCLFSVIYNEITTKVRALHAYRPGGYEQTFTRAGPPFQAEAHLGEYPDQTVFLQAVKPDAKSVGMISGRFFHVVADALNAQEVIHAQFMFSGNDVFLVQVYCISHNKLFLPGVHWEKYSKCTMSGSNGA